mmetsp:Transcript_24618/g.24854  ORF Transcript_24618/g.24854 Transcript_24618/m.24854 type:complete len:171 (-) Transcript_24618:45-557(-)|eukprot:CAMPEP_0182451572 /NCGR_PEP_ID=MMETSP1172-20130603/43792_1 /TAXON_ID=708627 /ORGANISM="Timspurckia oligopyrenoides, Strain CCMP3278" /LENGTH=170 /DNA_ID=CAMNT_0024649355 /DNA_START=269 /DNA_END=781 /DNA_ORIENTATION=+
MSIGLMWMSEFDDEIHHENTDVFASAINQNQMPYSNALDTQYSGALSFSFEEFQKNDSSKQLSFNSAETSKDSRPKSRNGFGLRKSVSLDIFKKNSSSSSSSTRRPTANVYTNEVHLTSEDSFEAPLIVQTKSGFRSGANSDSFAQSNKSFSNSSSPFRRKILRPLTLVK